MCEAHDYSIYEYSPEWASDMCEAHDINTQESSRCARKGNYILDDYKEYNQFREYLSGDEYIIWQGRPEKGHIFCKYDFYMVPFSLLCGGFAIFWEASVIASGGPFFFKLWGIPFVLVGLYMIVGRFFVQQYMRGRTRYAITDKRVLQIRGGKLTCLDRNALPEIQLTVNRDGSGTIAFGNGYSFQPWGQHAFRGFVGMHGNMYGPSMRPARYDRPILENIRDVNQVYHILMEGR